GPARDHAQRQPGRRSAIAESRPGARLLRRRGRRIRRRWHAHRRHRLDGRRDERRRDDPARRRNSSRRDRRGPARGLLMGVIRPFAAWRSNTAVVGDLAGVVAPPYDVINDEHRDALYERSTFNVVRLILGRESDRYAAAATCMAQWTENGALVRD